MKKQQQQKKNDYRTDISNLNRNFYMCLNNAYVKNLNQNLLKNKKKMSMQLNKF